MSKTTHKKLAVINFSGNVGKSTISKYLLLPRLEDCELITIETVNSNEFENDDYDSLKGKEFASLIKSLDLSDNFIADVGASNAEVFFEQMIKFDGSHEFFDYFIVPVVPKIKQQTDTVSTIKKLSSIGVPKEKIMVVFNMVEDADLLEKTFSVIFDYSVNNTFILNADAVIKENEFYMGNKNTGKSIEDLVNDPRNLRELARETKDKVIRFSLIDEMALQMLARTVKRDLDNVFSVLFPA
jgi:MinD-like ATPase involved in chromosome partitioning or flagellar assembly